MVVVADTSALVSLGTVAGSDPDPLDVLLDSWTVAIPQQVVEELRETAAYDDASADGAAAVLDRLDEFEVRTVVLDETFPLDDGENAAVTLANDHNAEQLLCDEFNQLALVHASLTGPRLVTTPTLLVSLARGGALTADHANSLLDEMTSARSWTNSAYVDRARKLLPETQ